MSSNLIKNNLGEGANRYNYVRRFAREKCLKEKRLVKCERCGYNKHVEVCHVKPISSFSLESSIDEVNSFDNLLILCPNCHWEHDNINKTNSRMCPVCYSVKDRYAEKCGKCAGASRKKSGLLRKVERPSKEELINLINEFPMTTLAVKFGVSDNAIRKWCREYDITLPNRQGYWAKQRSLSKI